MTIPFGSAFLQRIWSHSASRRLLVGLREFGPLRGWAQKVSGYRMPYRDFEEARAALAAKPIGYEHCAPDIYSSLTTTLIPGDYPAMFWLQQHLTGVGRLFDYGGNIGLQFYSYSRYFRIPPELKWTVCDIDPFVAEGIQLSRERNASQLEFCYDFSQGNGAEVFLVSGSLHYLEGSFSSQLKQLATPPLHLILNRNPLIEGPETVTLQDIGGVLLPVVLRNAKQFIAEIESAGYELVDQWEIQGLQCVIPLYPELSAFSYTGFYFRRNEAIRAD